MSLSVAGQRQRLRQAMGRGIDGGQREAWRRGQDGWTEHVYQGGKKVGTVRRALRQMDFEVKGYRVSTAFVWEENRQCCWGRKGDMKNGADLFNGGTGDAVRKR